MTLERFNTVAMAEKCFFRSEAMQGKAKRFTYRNLLELLRTMTNEQLSQPVQVANHQAGDDTLPLCPVITLAPVGILFGEQEDDYKPTRSSFNNEHRPDEVVLLADSNPFSPTGVASYAMEDDGLYANTRVTKDGTIEKIPEAERVKKEWDDSSEETP